MFPACYAAAGVPVRDDLEAAHRFLWEHLRAPGTWWTGAQRLAIAAETRRAQACALCRDRKAALSPNGVAGTHGGSGELSPTIVEAIHRIRTDPARLSRAWFDGVRAGGLGVAEYVELVGVVAMTTGIDFFARALGVDPFSFPEPLPGEPTRYLPPGAARESAWVPLVAVKRATGAEADLYDRSGFVPNIVRALSLVPAEVRALQRVTASHYVPAGQIANLTLHHTLDRMQMELLASRVSALNQCFY
jgi:hypothetical protein